MKETWRVSTADDVNALTTEDEIRGMDDSAGICNGIAIYESKISQIPFNKTHRMVL